MFMVKLPIRLNKDFSDAYQGTFPDEPGFQAVSVRAAQGTQCPG